MSFLQYLKQKPNHIKKIISLVSAIFLTLMIIFLWSAFSRDPINKKVIVKENKLSSVSPIQMIKDEFSKAFSNFKTVTEEVDFKNMEADSTLSSSTVLVEIIEATDSTSSPQATNTATTTTSSSVDNLN